MAMTGTAAPPQAHRTRASDFRPDIEGMRAIAVLLVVLFHAGVTPLTGGFIGVDVFFVISGFLITRLLLAEARREGRVRLAEFWARRARRLLPASALVLVAVVATSFLVVDPLGRMEIGKDVTASAAFLANWWFADQSLDYFAADRSLSPVLHFWSLSVEEQYYLVWPPLLAGLLWWTRRRGGSSGALRAAGLFLTVAGALSLAWALWETASTPVRAYYGTPARAWELAVGGLVAVATLAGWRLPGRVAGPVAWAGLAVIGVAAIRITEATPFPGSAALGPVLGTAAVLMAGATGGRGGPFGALGARVPREIGRLSYSWYLWHWPFLVLAPAVLGVAELSVTQTLAVVGASLLAAWLTFHVIEDPVRRHRGLTASAPRSLTLGATLITTGLLAGLLAARVPLMPGPGSGGAGSPGPGASGESTTITPDPVDARKDTNRIRADKCQSLFDWTEVKECIYAHRGADRAWVLWGDSHAVQWFPALEASALEAGVALHVYGKTSCPPSLVQIYSHKWDRTYTECTGWRDEVYRRVQAMPAGTVVFLNGMHGYAVEVDGRILRKADSVDLIAAGWRQVAQRLTELGMTVVSIRDTPFPPLEVPACVAANLDDPSRCDFALGEQDRGTSWEEQILGDIPGVVFVDLLGEVCPERTCPAVVDGILRWRDRDHLTATYVETLDGPLAAHLRDLGVMAPNDPAGDDVR